MLISRLPTTVAGTQFSFFYVQVDTEIRTGRHDSNPLGAHTRARDVGKILHPFGPELHPALRIRLGHNTTPGGSHRPGAPHCNVS